MVVALCDGGFVGAKVHGAAGRAGRGDGRRRADGDQAVDPVVEGAIAEILDVEDRPDVAHHPADRRQHQVGAVVEVAVHGSVRHAGTFGDGLDGRFVVALVGQLDQRVEHGVLVAVAASRAAVDDQVDGRFVR